MSGPSRINSSSGGSSTVVMEMTPLPQYPSQDKNNIRSFEHETSDGSLPAPNTAAHSIVRWNSPRINMWRVFSTFYSFIILGANDAAYGALIPYLEIYYNINYTVVSLVFLSPIVGYTASAILNNSIHTKFGQRGVAVIMSLSHVVAYTVICVHPPYPVLVVVFIFAGFGNGLGDAGWNAWMGDMANANEVLGFLHAFYGVGAALSPLIATTVITQAGWQWFEFYYLMVGASALEVVFLVAAFWKSNAVNYRTEHPQTAYPEGQEKGKSRTAEAVGNKVTLLVSFFLLVYVGVEVSIGGWIVTFMLRVRGGSPFASGLVSTGFWAGITVGRMVLGFVTARLGEKLAVTIYIGFTIALQLMFWLIPKFVVSAVMVGFLGFFLGPFFPAAVVVLTKLLPKKLHVAAVGFCAAFGASGACALPFAVGAIANAKGVGVLQPVILAGLVLIGITWLAIPRLPKVRTA